MESDFANCLVYEYLKTVNTKTAKLFKKHKRITEDLSPDSPNIADIVQYFNETGLTQADHGEVSDEKKKNRKRKRIEKAESEYERKAVSGETSTEGRKIFIKNLGKKFVYEDLKELVEEYGEVVKFLNSGRGFGFLTYSRADSASACNAAINNTKVAGRTIKTSIAGDKPVPAPAPEPSRDTVFTKRVDGLTLFVNGVKKSTANDSLKEVFEQFGSVTESLNTGKGYAFVTFGAAEEASSAQEALNGTEVCGTNVSIEVSQAGVKAGHINKDGIRSITRVFVNNVKKDASKDDIKAVFSTHGKVTDVQHHGKDFAFVSFACAQSAEAAVRALHGQIWPPFCQREIECNIARVQRGRKRKKRSKKSGASPSQL